MEKSRTLADNLLSNMPYAQIQAAAAHLDDQNSQTSNAKYQLFDKVVSQRENKLRNLSISQKGEFGTGRRDENGNVVPGGLVINKDYNNFVYSQLEQDKIRRVQEMRKMSTFAEVADCLDEICDEAWVTDPDTQRYISLTIKGDHSDEVVKTLTQEFDELVDKFDLETNGWEYFRQLLIEGEIYFENIVSAEKPWHGILGVVNVPCEMINPVYINVQNGEIREFQLRVIKDSDSAYYQARNVYQQQAQQIANMQIQSEERVPMSRAQITYIHSGMWNDTKTFRLPILEKARRAYKQLSLVEDAIVIYRLVRAPERLVFKIDVGNMSGPAAEAYLQRQMQQYWTKKSLDEDGRIQNSYDPQSMLDSYWFAKRQGTEGSDVTSLAGGANLGSLEDLNYFIEKLYKSLNVPLSRRQPDTPARDGTEITREELRFARFVTRVQHQFAIGIKAAFITHLKLLGKNPSNPESKSWWSQFELYESDIVVRMTPPTNFAAMKEQQLFELLQTNFNNMAGNEMISTTYAMRRWLKMTDEEMRKNHALLRYDAALTWELEQIVTLGPNFREELKKQDDEMGDDGFGDMGGGGGGSLGGGGGGSSLPDFGDMEEPGGGDEGGDDEEPGGSELPEPPE